jgi:hypothetical protein
MFGVQSAGNGDGDLIGRLDAGAVSAVRSSVYARRCAASRGQPVWNEWQRAWHAAIPRPGARKARVVARGDPHVNDRGWDECLDEMLRAGR